MDTTETTLDRLEEIDSDCEYAYYHDGVTGSLVVKSDTGNTLLPPNHAERWDVLEVVESREDALDAARAWEGAR